MAEGGSGYIDSSWISKMDGEMVLSLQNYLRARRDICSYPTNW
jgi:hypothetical protein